jgi:hypothetical protein
MHVYLRARKTHQNLNKKNYSRNTWHKELGIYFKRVNFRTIENQIRIITFEINFVIPCKAGLGNVRPTGHMRPAKHINVARKHFLDW